MPHLPATYLQRQQARTTRHTARVDMAMRNQKQKWRRSLPKCTRQLGRGGPARCPQNNGRLLELAALGSQRLRPNRRKTAQESSARGENRGHRGGTMRAEGALHTSVSSAWRRPSRWRGEAVARDKRRAAARCSHPSALSAGSPVQPNSRELSTKCMEPSNHSCHPVTTVNSRF